MAVDDGTPNTNLYRCDRCNRSFQKERYLLTHWKETCGKAEVQCEDCEYIAPNKAHYETHRRKFHASKESANEEMEGDSEGLTEDDIGESEPSKKLRNMTGISIVKLEESRHDPLEKKEEKEPDASSPDSIGLDHAASDDGGDEDWAQDVKSGKAALVSGLEPSSCPASDVDETHHTDNNAPEGLTEEDVSHDPNPSPSKKLFKLAGISCVKLEESSDKSPREGEPGERNTPSPLSVGEDHVASDESSDDEDWDGGSANRKPETIRSSGSRKWESLKLSLANRPPPARPKIVCGVCQKGCANSEELKSHVLSEHMNKGGPKRKPGMLLSDNFWFRLLFTILKVC